MTALQSFFSGDGFMPHGMCYLWQPKLLWLHVLSDSLVALSYFAIPPVLIYLVLRARRELADGGAHGLKGLPYESMFLAFGIFIVACGLTHVLAVYTVWNPAYWISGGAKAVTAAASVATAVALPPLVPKVLTLMRDARNAERHRVELEEAHEELRAVNERLTETDRLKTELFANVSHELRTPLTLILGPTEELLHRAPTGSEERRALEVVRRNALRLLSHVDDLLEAASLESGATHVRVGDADLADTTRQVAAHFDGLADGRRIDFRVEAPPSIPATVDRPKIERVLLNLLSNAFKFVRDGGSVRVRATEAIRGDARWIELSVEDDGPGVPLEQRELVFERFRQGDGGSTRRVGGTGLGLAIARDFAHAHGGTLELEDSELGGARFTLSLPSTPIGLEGPVAGASPPTLDARPALAALETAPTAPGDDAPTPAPGERERGRVLVVEDNPDMRRFLGQLLHGEYRCATADDGDAGLAAALDDPPDLVVTDLMMPGKSGWELVREMGAHPELSHVPVLVLTARADPALPAALLSEGARDYVVKPVRPDELRARVRNLVTASRAAATLRGALASRETDLLVLSRTLADRKAEIERAYEERGVLLRELHHRVKGNLQTLASLLRIQRRSLADPAAIAAMEDAEARVGAISLLHETLYAGEDAGHIEMGEYLTRLVARQTDAIGGLPDGVVLDVDVRSFVLDVERAIPCGLIAHELVANALRHGVRAGAERLSVSLRVAEGGELLVLRVSDDGSGLGAGRPGGFGLDLVTMLAKQLRAEVEREEGAGTRWVVTMPASARAGAHGRTQR